MNSEYPAPTDHPEIDVEETGETLEFDPDLMQQVSRIQRPDFDQLIGYYRVRFAEGQKREVVHVLIHPPMETIPEVTAHALEAPPHRIRVTDCERFGIRLELVLDAKWDGEAAGSFLVEVLATARRGEAERP